MANEAQNITTPAELEVYNTLADRILADDAQTLFLIKSKLFEHYYLNNPQQRERMQTQAIESAKKFLKNRREEALDIAEAIGFAKTPSNLTEGMTKWVEKMATSPDQTATLPAALVDCQGCKTVPRVLILLLIVLAGIFVGLLFTAIRD